MKSLYQFRLLDELKASDTQVRISQLIGRKNEDWSLRDVEFQKETVVLQNGDGSVFEMAFASASGGVITFHKRGLDENNPPVEKKHNKKTWGNGTKCYITAGAGDFIDKDEAQIWNGGQTFTGWVVIQKYLEAEGQINAKRGVKNPTFTTKEEATAYFTEVEKVEGLLVNIKGNTYRRNSVAKNWEMLGLADINQEKVQDLIGKVSTLEEKTKQTQTSITTLENKQIDHLEESWIVGERYTLENQLFKQYTPKAEDSTIAINVGDIDKNKEIHIQRIGSWTASNQLKLKMKKFWAPTTSVIVEVRKWVKVDVSDTEAYRYGGGVIATTTIAYTEFTTDWKEFTLTLNNQFWSTKGELLDIVVYQQWGIVNSTNYYQIACDSTQYSEAFSYVSVNWSSRVREKLMPYCISDWFAQWLLAKLEAEGKVVNNSPTLVLFVPEKQVVANRGHGNPVIKYVCPHDTELLIEYTQSWNWQSYSGDWQIVSLKNWEIFFNRNQSNISGSLLVKKGDIFAIASYNGTSSEKVMTVRNLKIYDKNPLLKKTGFQLYPRALREIGETIPNTIIGRHINNGRIIRDWETATTAQTGSVVLGNAVGYKTDYLSDWTEVLVPYYKKG